VKFEPKSSLQNRPATKWASPNRAKQNRPLQKDVLPAKGRGAN